MEEEEEEEEEEVEEEEKDVEEEEEEEDKQLITARVTVNLSLTDVVGEEYNKEWSDEVIDSLHIATSRMSH